MGTIVVPYAQLQQAFTEDPAALHDGVDKAADAAAHGNDDERARLVAQWHDAVAALESVDQGSSILSTPQNALASRLQTLIATNAAADQKVQTAVPQSTVTTDAGDSTAEETVQVKL